MPAADCEEPLPPPPEEKSFWAVWGLARNNIPVQFPAAFHLIESQFCLQELLQSGPALLAQCRDKPRADFHLGSVFSAVDGLEEPSAPGGMKLLQHFPVAPSVLAFLLNRRRALMQGRVGRSPLTLNF